MKSQVCVIGSFNVDIISYLPRLPTIGESLLASNFIFSPGGKGCNQALAASFADTDVYFITKVGTDHFSDYAINFMNSSKIYKSIIYQTKETQTGTATILVNEGTGDNVIAIYPGANMTMSSDEITIQKEAIINSDVILLQLETNYTALQQAITLAQKNSIPVIINPAPYNDIVNELIQDVDYITPNETEAGLLSGIDVHDLESATGTINRTEVHPREVIKRALYHNAAAVVLAHNHPSGEVTPSKADRLITERLVQALGLVDIRVPDHLIVGGNQVFSFAEHGLL